MHYYQDVYSMSYRFGLEKIGDFVVILWLEQI